MIPRTCRACFLLSMALLVALTALCETGSSPLRAGDTLPAVAGETLNGQTLDLAAATRGKAAVAIFSFSRTGGRDAQNWAQHFSKDDPTLDIYNVIFLESVPRLLRPMVVSAIRGGMPPDLRTRTLILYRRETFWEQALHVRNDNSACVLVLGPDGTIRWLSEGPFAEDIYGRAKAALGR